MASTASIDSQLTQALESQTRALMSELDKRLRAIDSKWESRVAVLEGQVADSMRRLDSLPKEICDEVDSQLAMADEAVDDQICHLEATTLTRVARVGVDDPRLRDVATTDRVLDQRDLHRHGGHSFRDRAD